MRRSFAFLCGALLFHLPMPGAQDPQTEEALHRVSREAARFWQTAPGFIGREAVTQKALGSKRTKLRIGVAPPETGKQPSFETREMLSFYALGALHNAPEALREFRVIYSVDGTELEDRSAARAKLAEEITAGNDNAKLALIRGFEKRSLAGTATDFGQLILLFTRAHVPAYKYQLAGDTRIGADVALLIQFEQQAGNQSLHISEAGKRIAEKLRGEIWVRQGDYLPLRIVLNSTRTRSKIEVRDEAKLDYTVVSGALLPAALVYRHFLKGELVVESIYRYSDWQPVKTP